MAGTFGLFNTAYSGLAAARAALEVTGENVSNVNTPGYTRQRVEQVSLPGPDVGLHRGGLQNIGQGVKITGIARLADAVIDARVRDTASSEGYWSTAASALNGIETSLGEPGDTGLSKALSTFWSAWQAVGNAAGTAGSGVSTGASASLLGAAQNLAGRITTGYAATATAWADTRTGAAATVDEINQAGRQVATLNQQISSIEAGGGNANELRDQRDAAVTTLANLAGATLRQNGNGTVDVLVGGRTFVSQTSVRELELHGAREIGQAGSAPVGVSFKDEGQPAVGSVLVEGGALAARLSVLAPASAGGALATTAAAYDTIASELTLKVNDLHDDGVTASGAPGGKFFDSRAGGLASTFFVVPKAASEIAIGKAGAGKNDASIADAIAQIGTRADAPDRTWSDFVTATGGRAQAAAAQSGVATSAANAAGAARTSQNGVDLDEETANLVVFQHAYQGAARVLTAVDEMLDTLINRTGLVGR